MTPCFMHDRTASNTQGWCRWFADTHEVELIACVALSPRQWLPNSNVEAIVAAHTLSLGMRISS